MRTASKLGILSLVGVLYVGMIALCWSGESVTMPEGFLYLPLLFGPPTFLTTRAEGLPAFVFFFLSSAAFFWLAGTALFGRRRIGVRAVGAVAVWVASGVFVWMLHI